MLIYSLQKEGAVKAKFGSKTFANFEYSMLWCLGHFLFFFCFYVQFVFSLLIGLISVAVFGVSILESSFLS